MYSVVLVKSRCGPLGVARGKVTRDKKKTDAREAREQKEVVNQGPENLRGDTSIFFSFSIVRVTGQYNFKNKERVI